MISEQVRHLIWKSLIAAESRSVYFGRIASSLQTRERFAALFVGVTSSLAFLNLISRIKFPWVSEGFSLLSAVGGAYLGLTKQNKAGALAASLCRTWGQVQDDFELLWHETPSLDDATTLARWRTIEEKHYEADESANALRSRRRLMRAVQKHVNYLRGTDANERGSAT
jgi:hypothetical protein